MNPHTPDIEVTRTEHISTTSAVVRSELSIAEILIVLLRHVRLIVLTPLVFAFLAALLLFTKVNHTAESSFTLTVNPTSASRLAGLAAQFGLQAGSAGRPAESLDFYVALVKSREVLRQVVLSEYQIPNADGSSGTMQGTLPQLQTFAGETEAEQLQRAIRALRKQISVSANQTSGVVTVKTTARSPFLAEQINNRILDIINQFNIDLRASQASIERQFIEQRMEEARIELHQAEDELSAYLSSNRMYSAPRVAFEQGRLQHRVDLQRQVYLSLAQAYEQARIEEVRNTPLITIIDSPALLVRSRLSIISRVILAAAIGAMLAIGWAFVVESTESLRRFSPDTFTEVDTLRRTALRRIITFPFSRAHNHP